MWLRHVPQQLFQERWRRKPNFVKWKMKIFSSEKSTLLTDKHFWSRQAKNEKVKIRNLANWGSMLLNFPTWENVWEEVHPGTFLPRMAAPMLMHCSTWSWLEIFPNRIKLVFFDGRSQGRTETLFGEGGEEVCECTCPSSIDTSLLSRMNGAP